MTATPDYQGRQRPRNVGKTTPVKPLGRLKQKQPESGLYIHHDFV